MCCLTYRKSDLFVGLLLARGLGLHVFFEGHVGMFELLPNHRRSETLHFVEKGLLTGFDALMGFPVNKKSVVLWIRVKYTIPYHTCTRHGLPDPG